MRFAKYWKQVLCIGLILGLFTAASVETAAVSLSSFTSESIREKEGQISAAQSQRKELQNGLTDIKKMKQELESQKANLENYVVALDADLAQIQAKIEELKGLIAEKEGEIQVTEAELQEAIDVQTTQYEAMKTRIKFMYEKGDSYYMDLLSEASSFSDILNKFDYIQMLSAYDHQKLQEYALITEYVETCKQELVAEKEVLDEAKVAVEAEEASLEELISAKEGEIVAYQSDISTKAAAIAEYEAEIAAQNELIAALEAAVQEERKKLAQASGRRLTYDGGMSASLHRITPEYRMTTDTVSTRFSELSSSIMV